MPQVIVFTSPKGGCGSTFACSLTGLSLSNSDHKVLVVDMCFERGNLDFALEFQNDYVYTLSDVCAGMCSIGEACVTQGQLSFVRAGYEKNTTDISSFKDILPSTEYEYVLIDIPCFDEDIRDSVLEFADKLIIVTDPLEASCKMCDIYLSGIDFPNVYLIVNKIIPSYVKIGVQMTVDEVLDTLCIPLLGLVPWCPNADVDRGSTDIPDTQLNTAFSNITLRLEGKRVPAMEINKVYDCFRFSRNFMKGRN